MLTWELIIGGMIIAFLVVYALTGGADFGGGIWDAFAIGPTAEKQRKLIAREIGPIWEANHVWLIAIIVVLFIAFPKGFAYISTALHIPLTIMLFGIVFRGSAFVFRSYDHADASANWSRVFSISSILTPIMLGITLAATSSGNIRFDAQGKLISGFWASWATPFPLAVGLVALAVFAFLAATYLTVRAEQPDMRELFRKRAIAASIMVFLSAWLAFFAAMYDAPNFYKHLTETTWAWPFHIACALTGGASVFYLWKRSFRKAQLLAGFHVTLLILGWATSHFPYVLLPDLTIWQAAAPKNILATTFYVFLAGSVFLVPSFIYLFKVFAFTKADST